MPGRRGQGARSDIDWFPQDATVAPGALAANAQATLLDVALQNPITSQSYDAGAIFGIRLWTDCFPAAAITEAPYVVVMVLPNGMAIPSVLTVAAKKQQEKFIWFQYKLASDSIGASATTSLLVGKAEVGSSRRYDPGDRLVIVLVNGGAVAFGAGSAAGVLLDSYIREA